MRSCSLSRYSGGGGVFLNAKALDSLADKKSIADLTSDSHYNMAAFSENPVPPEIG